MWIPAGIQSSKAKRRLLRNPELWLKFDSYFAKDWQAMETLKRLHAAGADLRLLGELAIWIFHPLGSAEAQGKLVRGRMVKRGLKRSIAGHETAIETYNIYVTPVEDCPKFHIVSGAFEAKAEQHRRLATEEREMLARATSGSAFRTRRMGLSWNRGYIYLLKAYISRLTGWGDRLVLSAITYLVSAAYEVVGMNTPHDLRVLLRKSLRSFEHDPNNRILIEQMRDLVANRRRLYRLFPPLSTSAPQTAT